MICSSLFQTADCENDPPQSQSSIMHLDYQNLNPNTSQSDSVYQTLDPNTNQSDSIYLNLDPNQSDSIYQTLDPNTKQSNSVYQTLNPAISQIQSTRV